MKRRQSRNSLSESSEQNLQNTGYSGPSEAQRRHEQQDAAVQRRRSGSSGVGQGRVRHGYSSRDGEREASRGGSEMRSREEGMDVD